MAVAAHPGISASTLSGLGRLLLLSTRVGEKLPRSDPCSSFPHGVTPTLSMHPPIAHAEHQQASTRISGMERRPGTSTTACMPSRVFSWFVVDSNSKVSQKDHLLDLLEEPDEVYGVCGTSFSESYVDNSHYCSIIRDNSTSFKGCGFSCTTYRAPLRCAEPPSSDLTTTSDLGDVPKSTSSRKSKNHQQQFLDEG